MVGLGWAVAIGIALLIMGEIAFSVAHPVHHARPYHRQHHTIHQGGQECT